MNAVTEAPARSRSLLRGLLVGLWVIAVLTALALIPGAFGAVQSDWQVNEAARMTQAISYETLTALIGTARLALSGLMLASAAVLLCLRPPAAALAALALLALPFTLNLVSATAAAGYPAPWATLVSQLSTALGVLGIAALFALLFLFPDGRSYPVWLRLPALAAAGLALAGMVAMQFIEAAWGVIMVALLGALLLAVTGQVLRYRAAAPDERRRTAGFLVFVLALPAWTVTGFSGFSPLLNLIAGCALFALLPLGLLLGVRRGLWGGTPARGQARLFAGAAALLGLAAVAGGLLWYQANEPRPLPAGALAALPPRPVILDTDMGMDDISALLYLVQHPAVNLRAITVNGVAFAHCERGIHNVLGLLEMARAEPIPVSCGREKPYPGGRPAPDAWRKGADALYGGQVRTGERQPDPRSAAVLLADAVRDAGGEAVIIALGPLTNLAEAFEADPALPSQVAQIVIMGGAVDAPGNVASAEDGIDNQYAEWNIFADPHAADVVLASGAPITLVPLDATNDVPFTHGFYQRLRAHHETRPATFVYNLMYMNPWWLDGGMYWWDTLAAAAALDETLLALRDERLDVVTEPGPEIGRTVRAAGGSPVRVAEAADARRFEALFLGVLNDEP